MQKLKICKICLVSDVKMYYAESSSVSNIYAHLTGSKNNHLLPLCYECLALLKKYDKFRTKCMTAEQILTNAIMQHSMLTEEIIRSIDRKENKLESSLKLAKTFNFSFDNGLDSDNKDENYEFDVIKSEPIIEPISDVNIKDDVEIKITNDKNIDDATENFEWDSVDDVVLSPDEDILSDDYVPPTKQRKKKTKMTIEKSKGKISKKAIKEKSKINCLRSSSKRNSIQENIVKSEEDIPDKKRRKKRPEFDMSYFEEYATVVVLTPEDARREVLLRKESSNYMNCTFKCEFCYRGYEAESTYKNHMNKHSPEYGEYKCDYCHLRFPKQRFLCKHRLSCHKRKFYCKICPYTCFCTSQAKIHVSLHKGKKYPCKECGEIFSMPNSLLMHKRIKHSTECVCDLCGSTFATERGLRSHKMLLHRQDTNDHLGPNCEECNVHFSTDTAWKRHLVLSSKHHISNGCEFCGEVFENEEALKVHLRVHARKQMSRCDVKLPGACPMCNKWLSDRLQYRAHLSSEHPDSELARKQDARDKVQCVCEVCGKMFKKQCFLLYHQRKHTGERPYKCHECGKTYAFPGALSTHKSMHAGKRIHKCDTCGKVFTFRSALSKHVKAHLGIRPHKCNLCDKSFPNPCDVKMHMQYVHYKVPWPKRDRSKRSKISETAPASYLYAN